MEIKLRQLCNCVADIQWATFSRLKILKQFIYRIKSDNSNKAIAIYLAETLKKSFPLVKCFFFSKFHVKESASDPS